MPDSIDHRDIGPGGMDRELLVNGEWPETDTPQKQAGHFEGASSFLEPNNSQADANGTLDFDSEQNLRTLLKDVEKLRTTSQVSFKESLAPEAPYVEPFLERARERYANHDFKKSLEILHDGLKLAPGNAAILALVEEVRQASEHRQAELEESGLADRIAQCKAEAIKLFEQGRYGDCIERFKVLAELEPTNSDLRDFLEISREQVEKVQSAEVMPPAEPVMLQETELTTPQETEPRTPQEVVVSSHDSQIPEPELLSPSNLEPLYIPVEIQSVVSPELSQRHSPRLFEPSQLDSVASFATGQNSATTDPSPDYPVAVQLQQLRLKAREEDRKQAEKESTIDELPEDPSHAARKKLTIACLAGVGLVIGAMMGAWLALAPGKHSTVPSEVQVTSDSNVVTADPVQSPAPASTDAGVADPQAQAQKAFQQGRLLEANRFCDTILQSAPDNPFALDLKQQIRGRYTKVAGRAAADQKWADASMAWHNLLKVFPGDPEVTRELKAAKANLKKEEQLALASKMEAEQRIGELQQQITLAMSSGRHLPPSPGNAFELIQKLEAVSSDNTFGRGQRDEILRHLVVSANRSLQVKDSARTTALVNQMETYFPEAPELKGLRDGLKAEQSRLGEARNSWMQKAEAAMAAGHYVTPASDNVLAHCRELLTLDPQNTKALELKKASTAKAGAQAKAWIQEGKYDEARAVYSALLYLPQSELQNLPGSQEIKTEIEKLTFNAHAVVHDHALGNCTGRLRFNGYQITYVPSSDSKDGFSAKISEVALAESDDRLKIQLKGKTYRFQINGVKDPQEIRTRISSIQRQLSALIASK
jgi:tetratricopeptide (TPR) repeat protein